MHLTEMMWRSVGINLIIAGLGVLTWYIVFRIVNRRRGTDALEWIERALSFHGEISAVKWLSASRLHVRLRMASSPFRQPVLFIQLMPREMPLEWLLNWWRGTKESALVSGAERVVVVMQASGARGLRR